MTAYQPGLHIVAEIDNAPEHRLLGAEAFREFMNKNITEFGLSKLGEVYHDFPGGGYTAVVCLSESHLSVHTWPEYGRVTYDVFLSNYQKNNDHITRELSQRIQTFFGAEASSSREVSR